MTGLEQTKTIPLTGILSYLENEFARIDTRANSEKRGITYLSKLMEKRWGEIVTAFSLDPHDPQVAENAFKQTEGLIKQLTQEHTRVVGITTNHFPEGQEPKRPFTALGWAEYSKSSDNPDGDGNYTWTVRLTEEGKDTINKYRSARGYVDLDEQRRLNRERARF